MVGRELGSEHGTAAFRRLLGEASAGEQARVDALVAFSQRAVYAATWPGQNQAVRTLTNRGGETAMPLFTGRDLLEDTATRFGWRNPDGTLPMRELNAREALQHALARGVHFVVVDIGSAHSVEFTREEVEPLLALQAQRNAAGPFAAKGEPEAAILDAVRRSSRPPATTMPLTAATRIPATGRLPSVEIDAPFAALRARGLSQPLIGTTRAVSQSVSSTMMDGTPKRQASQPMANARPASQPNFPAQQPSAAAAHSANVAAASPVAVVPAAVPSPVRAAEPAPAPAPYVLPPSDKPPLLVGLNRPAEEEPVGAQAGVTKAAALEVAAALTSAAKAAGDVDAQKAAEEMAKMLMQSTVSNEVSVPDKRSEAAASAGRKMAALFMGAAMPEEEEPAEDRESGEQVKEQPPGSPTLPDSLLQGISGGLRSFPEVEWACVLADDTDVPVIGVRVDPSFLNRVAQITDGILGMGEKQGQDLQVQLLSTPDSMKSARKHGTAFYPWKR